MEVVMKKIFSINLMLAAAFAVLATSAFAGPSRSFIQEMGSVQANKEVTIDISAGSGATAGTALPAQNTGSTTALLQTNAGNFQVNVGAFGGEVRVGHNPVSPNTLNSVNYLGYKAVVIPNLALYANVGITSASATPTPGSGTVTGETDITVGGAYTFNLMPVILNLNPEYKSLNTSYQGTAPAVYQNSVLNINAAILFPVSADWIIGAEYLYSSIGYSGSTTGTTAITNTSTLGLGVRWKANNNVTIDGLVYGNLSTSQDTGTAPSYSDFATPAILRVNIKI